MVAALQRKQTTSRPPSRQLRRLDLYAPLLMLLWSIALLSGGIFHQVHEKDQIDKLILFEMQSADVRENSGGGIPLEQYQAILAASNQKLHLFLAGLWLMGMVGVGWVWRSLAQWLRHEEEKERLLEASERRYRFLFENLTAGFALSEILCDSSGTPTDFRFLDVNPAFYRHTGLPSVQGKTLRQVMPGIEERWLQVFGQVASTGEPLAYIDHMKELGRYYDTWAFCPQPGQLAVILSDVTESQLIKRERELLLGQLQDKNEEMKNLVYIASHDLRSPLVNIDGFSRRLARVCTELNDHLTAQAIPPQVWDKIQPLLQESIPRSLDFIQTSARKMDGLINGLLALFRVARREMNPQRVELTSLLEEVAANHRFQLDQIEALLHVEALPSCWGDRQQLSQVFSNLLDNAIKYRSTERPLRISIDSENQGHEAFIRICDNGRGIAPACQKKVFDVFYREDPKGSPGDGLGLSLVQRIVQRHGGRVRLESDDAGSRFTVVLPRNPFPAYLPTGENA